MKVELLQNLLIILKLLDTMTDTDVHVHHHQWDFENEEDLIENEESDERSDGL